MLVIQPAENRPAPKRAKRYAQGAEMRLENKLIMAMLDDGSVSQGEKETGAAERRSRGRRRRLCLA